MTVGPYCVSAPSLCSVVYRRTVDVLERWLSERCWPMQYSKYPFPAEGTLTGGVEGRSRSRFSRVTASTAATAHDDVPNVLDACFTTQTRSLIQIKLRSSSSTSVLSPRRRRRVCCRHCRHHCCPRRCSNCRERRAMSYISCRREPMRYTNFLFTLFRPVLTCVFLLLIAFFFSHSITHF